MGLVRALLSVGMCSRLALLITGYSISFSACISQRSSAVNIVFTAKGAEIFRRVRKGISSITLPSLFFSACISQRFSAVNCFRLHSRLLLLCMFFNYSSK